MEEGMTETGNERAPSATTWPKCVKTCPSDLLFSFQTIITHPSPYYTFANPSRAFSSFDALSHTAADFVPSIHTAKKKRSLF
jgi:hypothetical protein